MLRTTIVVAAGLALAALLPAAPAHALRARVFVSKTGADVGNCSFSAPCQSLNFAYNAVLAGGEITMLDSAGYEPITITKGVTITSPAGVEAGIVPVAGGDAIDISAGPNDAVVLRGLTLNGSGIGYNGIVFNSGGSLTVTDCVIQNFVGTGVESSGNGIWMRPSAGTVRFVITNTVVLNNRYAGISYDPLSGTATANGVIDHVVVTNNSAYGIALYTGAGGGSTTVAISNSIVSDSTSPGLGIGININNGSAALTVSIDNTSVSGNSYGIYAAGTPNVMLGRSVITANSTDGVQNSTSPNTFYSYLDNRINGNTTDVGGTALISHALK